MVKFTLLILPGRSEMPLQMRISFQLGIPVGRQHFSVGINIDSPAFCLFQKEFQITQIMACDHDEGALFYGHGYISRNRRAVGLRIGPVQQGHAGQIDLARFHDQRQKLSGRKGRTDGSQTPAEKA